MNSDSSERNAKSFPGETVRQRSYPSQYDVLTAHSPVQSLRLCPPGNCCSNQLFTTTTESDFIDLKLVLQVLEMFGSSCDLHLEMPLVGEDDPSLDWWLIPPHQSKAIAKVNFLASRAVNVTAFVRIRTNYTAQPHGSLMLPVSLEVTSQPLLFCPQQYLDFGVVDVLDAPRTLKLFVINSGKRPITVQVSTNN